MQERVIGSELITLRKTARDDLDFVISAESERENAQYVGQWPRDEHLRSLDNEDMLHLVVESTNKTRIGYIIMAGLKNVNHSIEFRRIVITDKGKGYGREALRLVKELAFTKLGAHRLWLDVREKNARARYVYRSLGFTEEGKLRECILFDKAYESLIMMSILENEYQDTFEQDPEPL